MLRSVVSEILRRTLEQPMFLHGDRVACPLCQGEFRMFRRGPDGRPNATCPRCGSLERHRVLWLFLERHTTLLTRPAKVMHFAPERSLSTRLQQIHGSNYTSGDLDGTLAMEAIDITDIAKEDGLFDAVIASHVLEHVPADVQAMREIKRVLAPGGIAVLQHPIDVDLALTYEDCTIVDPADRTQAFGQADHVRVYGRDFDS